MRNNFDTLIEEFGPVRWIEKNILGLTNEGWFLLELCPSPPKEEREAVIADIYKNRFVRVSNGKLYHSHNCKETDHTIPKWLRKAIPNIKEETFKVAVYPWKDETQYKQPLAICLEPEINYDAFPAHPHINMGGNVRKPNGVLVPIPASICYGYKDEEFGENYEEKLEEVFAQIAQWLFRHQVWLATKDIAGINSWIGNGTERIEPKYYIDRINPDGLCRCGSSRKYAECHMAYDYSMKHKCSKQQAQAEIKQNLGVHRFKWYTDVRVPQSAAVESLKKRLLIE